MVDDDTNSIVEWKWQLIPIDEHIAEPDLRMAEFIESFKSVVDRKYGVVITKFAQTLTHPLREEESTLGDLLADALAEGTQSDVVLLGAGSVRVKEMGPAVTLMDFMSCFPYDDSLTRFTVTGAALKRAFSHWMRPENRDGEGECYQVNAAVRASVLQRGPESGLAGGERGAGGGRGHLHADPRRATTPRTSSPTSTWRPRSSPPRPRAGWRPPRPRPCSRSG